MKLKKMLLACVVAACILPVSGNAQVVREDGVKSIAGVLVPGFQDVAEWTFKSHGGEILFATLDAEIYRARTEAEHHTDALVAEEEGEGCSGEGGPGMFYLEVAGQDDGAVLCHAERPLPPPGWQRDPRMACRLPESKSTAGYVLRVGLKAPHELPQSLYSFLLNVSLRGIAPSGTDIQTAVARSANRGF